MVHEPLAGIAPPVNVTDDAPEVTDPLHVVLGAPLTVNPLGNVSVNGLVMLAAEAFALLKVIVSVEDPPALMVAGLKALPTVGGTGVIGAIHEETVITLESIVTAPFCARALPDKVASVVIVILVSARIFPMNVVPVPIVAELPTCQNTLQACAPLMSTTDALLAVMRVLATLNTQTALGSPPASRVSAPVI